MGEGKSYARKCLEIAGAIVALIVGILTIISFFRDSVPKPVQQIINNGQNIGSGGININATGGAAVTGVGNTTTINNPSDADDGKH